MHLALAIFWVIIAVLVQYNWDVLKEHAYIPIDRTLMGFIFFILFSYNFIRWRTRDRWEQVPHEPPPRPRVKQPIDPNFDFSDAPPGDDKKGPSAT